jgi:hypothetical protein
MKILLICINIGQIVFFFNTEKQRQLTIIYNVNIVNISASTSLNMK